MCLCGGIKDRPPFLTSCAWLVIISQFLVDFHFIVLLLILILLVAITVEVEHTFSQGCLVLPHVCNCLFPVHLCLDVCWKLELAWFGDEQEDLTSPW